MFGPLILDRPVFEESKGTTKEEVAIVNVGSGSARIMTKVRMTLEMLPRREQAAPRQDTASQEGRKRWGSV